MLRTILLQHKVGHANVFTLVPLTPAFSLWILFWFYEQLLTLNEKVTPSMKFNVQYLFSFSNYIQSSYFHKTGNTLSDGIPLIDLFLNVSILHLLF